MEADPHRAGWRCLVLGRYGAAGRGIFSGPAAVSTDLAVLKDVVVRESHRFQFRAEFFNIFNQVNLSNPVASLANARYGEITGSGPGRAIQFGLKYLWRGRVRRSAVY